MNISWTFFSSKLDYPVIKTLEIHFFTLSEGLSNILITGEISKKYSTDQSFILKKNFLKNPYFLKEKVLPLFLPKSGEWGTIVTLTPPGFDGPDKINNYTSKYNSTVADFVFSFLMKLDFYQNRNFTA